MKALDVLTIDELKRVVNICIKKEAPRNKDSYDNEDYKQELFVLFICDLRFPEYINESKERVKAYLIGCGRHHLLRLQKGEFDKDERFRENMSKHGVHKRSTDGHLCIGETERYGAVDVPEEDKYDIEKDLQREAYYLTYLLAPEEYKLVISLFKKLDGNWGAVEKALDLPHGTVSKRFLQFKQSVLYNYKERLPYDIDTVWLTNEQAAKYNNN